jgi:UrcA family protein
MKALKTAYAIPFALLMLSVALGAPNANAERNREYKTFQVRFVFNPADSAAKIYSELDHTAQKACARTGPTSARMQILTRACKADVLDQAVKSIGRTDIAALHYSDRMSVIASR